MKATSYIIQRISLLLLACTLWLSTQGKPLNDELLQAYYDPGLYNEIVERGVKRLQKLMIANARYAKLGQRSKMRFIFSLDKKPLYGVKVTPGAKTFIGEETQQEMNELLAELAGGNQKIKINALHFYVAVHRFMFEDEARLGQVTIKAKPTVLYQAQEFIRFKKKLVGQVFRKALNSKDNPQGKHGALMLVSKEYNNLLSKDVAKDPSQVKTFVKYDVQLAIGRELKGALSGIRKRLYKYRSRGVDANPYDQASFKNGDEQAFRHHIRVSCEEFLWNDYVNGPRIYQGAQTFETAIRQKPLILLANPRIKGDFFNMPRSEYIKLFGKAYLGIAILVAAPVLLEYITVQVSWQSIAAYFEAQSIYDAAKEIALYAVLEGGMMHFFEGKSWQEITQRYKSADFLKQASLAGLTGIFEGKMDEGVGVFQALGCVDIDFKKSTFKVKQECVYSAFATYLISKALSGNYKERLQRVFDKKKDRFVEGLARLGFACNYIERIASTLNLSISGAELCDLVTRHKKYKKRKHKDPKNKKKDDKKKDDNKNSGTGSQKPQIIAKADPKKPGTYLAQVVFKGKTGGKTRKGKGSKGGNNTKPIEVGRMTWDKARKEIKFIKLKPTSKAKNIRKNDILSKLLAEVKKKNPSRIVLGNTLDNAVKSWAKSPTVKYKYLLKVEKTQYLSAQEFWVRKKASKSTGDKWQAFQGVKVSATGKANDKAIAEAFFKDFGSEKHLLAFDFKKNKPSSEVAGKVMDALYKEIAENEEQAKRKLVSSIYIPKSWDKALYQTVEKQAGAVKDIGNQQFKSNIAKWAINKKNSQGQKIFLYAFITSDAKGQGRGGGVKITRTACFVAGTKVWLADYRQVNIEEIRPEDLVRSFDPVTGKEVIGRVSYTMVKEATTLIKIYTAIDTFLVTPEHPFYINGNWLPARNLKKGQKLTLLESQSLMSSKSLSPATNLTIDHIVVKDTTVTVYNFTVEKYHNYYVGNVGVLTHNKLCEIKRVTDKSQSMEYIVFQDDKSGSIHVKIDGGGKKANGESKLISLGNGSIGDGVNKKPKGKFSVTLKLKKKVDGKMVYKHPSIRGNFVLKTILDTEIKDYKKELKFFEANWSTGLPDNLNAFNNGIAGGMSKVEAANNTWSGDWFWENYGLACISENDINIKGTTKLPNGDQKITSVSVWFRKSSKRETGIYVAKSSTVKYKGEQKWTAYYSSKKKSRVGEGIYHKKLHALQIEIFENGKRKEKKVCDALLRKIRKGSNDKINVVFTTNKRDFQKLNLSEQLAKRRYLNNTIIKEFRDKVKKSKLSITDWATKNGFPHIYLGRDLKGNLQIQYLKYDNFTPRTLIHYTNKKAYEGILSSKVLFPSLKKGSTKFGPGQYFTDIFPSDIGGYSTADLKRATNGKKAAQQMALVLWGSKTRTRFMTHYVEIDVAGLKLKRNTTKGGYFVYKYPSTGNLNIKDRLISKGLTPYCSAYITKKIQGKEEIWELKATKQDSEPQIVATYIKTGKSNDKGALTIKSIRFSSGEKNAKKSWNLKKEWLTQLFNAVKSNQTSDNSSSSTQVNRDISVIVAMPNAGVDLNKFNAIKNSPQNKIDAEGQETLVGNWAANISIGDKKHEYKYTIIRSDRVRFAKTACFVAGTKVWLHNYKKVNIEDIHPQDTIRAFDPITKQEVLGIVNHTMIKQASTLIGVYTAIDTFWVTPEHPFYIDGDWIPARMLKKGKRLTLLNHSKSLASKTKNVLNPNETYIDSIVVKDTLVKVYNFTVSKYHNYYVGNIGTLVHNNDCCNPLQAITNKYPDEALPSDGALWGIAQIEDGKIKKLGVKGNTFKNIDYVINMECQLLIGKKHHFLGNKSDVQAAGTLKIVGGKIKNISNASGHYFPSIEEAELFPEIFRSIGLKTQGAWLEIVYLGDDGQLKTTRKLIKE